MRGIVIAFYTDDYIDVVRTLMMSLHNLHVESDIRHMRSLGEWELNCGQKPKFIRRMMEKYPKLPLLYVDADAIVRRDPWTFLRNFSEADIGVHYRLRPTDPRHAQGELLSGTILINPTRNAASLIDTWCDAQDAVFKTLPTRDQRTWDQKVLSACIDQQSAMDELRVAMLGPEMTFIFDTMRKDNPDVVPIIEHFQHSRKIKSERANDQL